MHFAAQVKQHNRNESPLLPVNTSMSLLVTHQNIDFRCYARVWSTLDLIKLSTNGKSQKSTELHICENLSTKHSNTETKCEILDATPPKQSDYSNRTERSRIGSQNIVFSNTRHAHNHTRQTNRVFSPMSDTQNDNVRQSLCKCVTAWKQ